MTTQRVFIVTCSKCRAGHLIDYPLGKKDNGDHAVEPIRCRECKNILTEDQHFFFKRIDIFLENWHVLCDKCEDHKKLNELFNSFFELISV